MASLVVQTSFLGDVILTTPLIAELARRGPVDVVTTAGSAGALANHPAVRNVIVYDKHGSDRGVRGFARTARRIRLAGIAGGVSSRAQPAEPTKGYDIAYMAQGSITSASLAVSAGIKKRIGFDTSAGRALYTSRVQYRPDRHHAERLWWLSMTDCADAPQPNQIAPRLYPGPADISSVDALLESFADSSRSFVALAPGSAWGTKRWPFFPELAAQISSGRNIVVVGGSGDVALGEEILRRLPARTGINAAGALGILASAELIRRAAALVSNDSAPQHLASAMATPTISVFGPTVPEFGFGPLAPLSATAGHRSLACRPCDSHGPERCPLGHWRCMRELSAGTVFDLLEQTQNTLKRATR